jgi:hypothetical protein
MMTSSNILSIISEYKSRIAQSHLQDEVYKWELVSKFKGRPDTNAPDFEKEYKSVKFGNLIYAMAVATGNFLVSEHPEELRSLFKHLFDETLPLNDRVEYFNAETLRIYKLIQGKHSHHQDERSISAYLTFHNPKKYTFYKNGFYVEFCKLMGVAPAGKNKKYSHYLELLNEFIQKYIVPDEELIEQVKSYIPAYYDGTNHLLLAQDILYSMLDRKASDEETNEVEENEFEKFIKQFNPKDFAQFIDFAREIINEHQLHFGDERLTFNYYEDRLVISVGQRYCLGLFSKDKKRKFTVLSKESFTDNGEEFDGENNKAFLNYLQEWNITEEQKVNIHEGIGIELNRTNRSGYRKHNKTDFEKYVFEYFNEKGMNNPINKILFGPPGTGKTYTLKTDYFPIYTTKESALSKEQHFEEVVRDLTWWQVVAVALIQSGKSKVGNLLKHPWILQKAKLSNSNTVRPTLWGQLQSHTIETCEFVNVKSKQQPFIFNKTEDSYWEIIEEEALELCPELYDLIDSVENFNPSPDKEIKRYVFTTFHQSFNYEDFIEGIKPVLADEEGNGDVSYRIEDGIFKALCKRAESDPENRYAIFIDEINRGNVSAIFGELITLIETDKRKGAEHPMTATLPYSKKQFAVPSNVDIYGTMNTADRSVEALDTALRRRFSFEEMLPKPTLLKDKGENASGKVGSIDLEKLLTTINERIEALVDRDHTIGHAFFMNVDSLESLQNTFAKNVIPLLQEYFYGDYAKMEMVIGPDFFNKDKRQKKVTFAVSNEDIEIPVGSYELMNVMNTDFDIEAALKRLLASN